MKYVTLVGDEASEFGPMRQIAHGLTIGRSFGLKFQLYYQDIGQLKKCWPDGADQTLLANTAMVAFAVNDLETAKYLCERIGKTTVISTSGGTNYSRSTQHSQNGSQGSYSTGGNEGWQETGRDLIQANEIMTASEREAFTFVPGMSPIRTWLVRYYEEDGNQNQRHEGFSRAVKDLFQATWLMAAVGFFAVVLSRLVQQPWWQF
jgi:type IV secretion system protein VirD4